MPRTTKKEQEPKSRKTKKSKKDQDQENSNSSLFWISSFFLIVVIGIVIQFDPSILNIFKSQPHNINIDTENSKETVKMNIEEPVKNNNGKPYSVVIVGGGLAGLSAALELSESAKDSNVNLKITILEKEAKMGGNSAKASSGINAVDSILGENDSVSDFVSDTIASGRSMASLDLVNILCSESMSALEWLKEKASAKLDVVSRCGGHSHPRTHRPSPAPNGRPIPVGWHLISSLSNALGISKNNENDNESLVSIVPMNDCKLLELIRRKGGDSEVIGVRYKCGEKEKKMIVDKVILTTGGFGADRHGLIKENRPDLTQLSTTNGPWAIGEGVRLATDIGASTTMLDQIQVHPTGLVNPKEPVTGSRFLGPEALRASGALLINSDGKRFVNELGLRDEVTKSIFKQNIEFPGAVPDETNSLAVPKIAWLVLNDRMVNKFGSGTFGFYKGKGFAKTASNAEELAAENGWNSDTFKETLTTYSKIYSSFNVSTNGETIVDEFGKVVFPEDISTNETLYSVIISPVIHYTMGGLVIDKDAKVLDNNGNWINGLWAAGEVTGGVHGANRLAGNSLLECVVFGRRAAKDVYNSLLSK